jgi:hypothetical protein
MRTLLVLAVLCSAVAFVSAQAAGKDVDTLIKEFEHQTHHKNEK